MSSVGSVSGILKAYKKTILAREYTERCNNYNENHGK